MTTDPTTPELIALAQTLLAMPPLGDEYSDREKNERALAQLVLDQKKELDDLRALFYMDEKMQGKQP